MATKKATKPAAKKPATKKPVAKKAPAKKPTAKPAVRKVSRTVAKRDEFVNSEVSIVVAMAVEAVILLIGYLVVMHYVA